MTFFMALDSVTSFLRFKNVTNICKRMRRLEFFIATAESWRKAEDFKGVVIVYCVLESK